MPGKTKRPRRDPKPVLAWLGLLMIIAWVSLSWPSAIRVRDRGATLPAARTKETTSTPVKTKTRAEITAQSLNLRSVPGTGGAIIGVLKRGTIVEVMETKPDWLQIRLEDGRTGYVAFRPDFIRVINQ